jgi:outer membrane protein
MAAMSTSVNALSRFSLIVLAYVVCLPVFSQQAWSLEQCVDHALKNNLSIQDAAIQKKLSALNAQQASSALFPSFQFAGNSGYRFGLSENPTTGIFQSTSFFNAGFSLNSSVTLFNWFSRRYSMKAADAALKADEWGYQKAQNDILLSVRAAYLQALLAEELKEQAQIQSAQTVEQKRIVEKKIGVGVLSEIDRSQMNVQLLADSVALLTAKEATQKSLLQLKAILNLDAVMDISIVPLTDRPDFSNRSMVSTTEGFFTQAQNLPQMQQLFYQNKAAQNRVQAARRTMYPTLSFFGSLGTNYVNLPVAQGFEATPLQATGSKVFVNGVGYDVMAPGVQVTGYGVTPFFRQMQRNFGQNLGLSLSVPIFNGKNLSANYRREQLNAERLKLQEQRQLAEVKGAIYTALVETETAIKKTHLLEAAQKEAADLYKAAQKRYNLNLYSTQDLLLAMNALRKAESSLVIAKYEARFKLLLLEFYRLAK